MNPELVGASAGREGSAVGAAAAVGALCAGAGCRRRDASGRARGRLTGRARLCRSCGEELVAGLESLPPLYDECGLLLEGSARSEVRTSGGPMPGMPFNIAAAEVRSAILGVLGSWSGMVAKERRIGPPRRSVAALAAFLATHADWLGRHTAAPEVSQEVARLVRSARRVAYPQHTRRVPVGSCVETGCPGELVAVVRPEQPTAPTEITCGADPAHRWSGAEWVRLSHRMAETDPSSGTGPSSGDAPFSASSEGPAASGAAEASTRWLSAADISRLWRTAAGSVYRLASEERWRRRSRSGRTYYHGGDVDLTFSRRASRRGAS